MTNWTKHHVAHDEDSNRPTLLDASSAPGESGVSVLRLRFAGSSQYAATLQRHFVRFQMHPWVRLDGPPASQGLGNDAEVGSFAIHPAGMMCTADVDETADVLMITIDPGRLALAAVENREVGAQLRERLSGYDDALFDVARVLAVEGAAGYPNGPHYWNDIASSFLDGLVTRHSTGPARAPRGMLGKATLRRIKDYILAHIDEPIEIAALAQIAGRSPFHFSRVFSRFVGMSPHRYIVHLRLRRAVELIREGELGLAGIAAATGFADQSHLSRWVRRVYGASLRELAP
jgi:AraC family transcriptional regulator